MIVGRRQILIGGAAAAVVVTGAAWVGLHGMGSMTDYDASVAASRATLAANPDLQELVRFATLAPSGHNTQPWRFRIERDRIELLPDFARRTPIVDPDDHHIFVGLGCAAENLVLAAAATGRVAEMEPAAPQDGGIAFRFRSGKPIQSALFTAMPHRQSTRGDYDGKPISTADLRTLATAAELPGVQTILITERRGIDRVRDLVLAGNTTQMSDVAFTRELKHWLRYNPRDAMRTGDGLFSVASGAPALPSWAGPLLFDRLVTAGTENKRYASQLDASAGVAVFVGASADPDHWIRVGRACQRFALQATALGLKCAFVNQPVEVPGLRPELASFVGAVGQRPDLVMRFGRGPPLPFSARRPTSAVLA